MDKNKETGPRQVWLVGLLAGLLGGLVSGLVFTIVLAVMVTSKSPQNQTLVTKSINSDTPALDYLDTLRCRSGMRHIVQVRGQEDGFARAGDEPSRIEPSLTRFGSFKDAAEGIPRVFALRAYDETGNDKQLIDYFEIPKGTISGRLILKYKPTGVGAENDYVTLVPSATFQTKSGAEMLAEFSIGLASAVQAQTDAASTQDPGAKAIPEGVLVIPLEKFVLGNYRSINPDLAPILNYFGEKKSDSDLLTMMIADDTALDVAALSLCVEPDVKMGVTLVEYSDKPLGPDMSLLACAKDKTQSFCDPYTGDTTCETALPLACYKDGSSVAPKDLVVSGYAEASFVGGEVKPSQPIAGAQFSTRAQADAFCARQFGAGWRILSYQDGSGGYVSSRSTIAPRTRLWIDIKDQPRGRCWDRPVSPTSTP
jgi:hypothetical protein